MKINPLTFIYESLVIQKLEMGQVFAWGSSTGAVGNPTQENLNVPLIVQALSSSNIERIACGAHHSVALSGFFILS